MECRLFTLESSLLDIDRWHELSDGPDRVAALIALMPFSVLVRPARDMEQRLRDLGLRATRVRGHYTYTDRVAVLLNKINERLHDRRTD